MIPVLKLTQERKPAELSHSANVLDKAGEQIRMFSNASTIDVPLLTSCPEREDKFMPNIFSGGSHLVKANADEQRRDIVDLLSRIGVFTNHFLVNFGCWLSDPSQKLWYDVATGLMMERGWAGIGFDSNHHLHLLRKVVVDRKRNNNVSLYAELLTGKTAPARLREKQVPLELDVLKVDIDSFDCDLARGILSDGFRPKMLHIEQAPVWPRGVRVEYKFGPRVRPYLGGCSCEAVVALGQEYGYILISAYDIDVTMIRSDLWHRHMLSKHFRSRIGCSTSCGTEFCRKTLPLPCAQWSNLFSNGKHEELAWTVAKTIAAGREGGRPGHTGNVAWVSSDHSDITLKIAAGKIKCVKNVSMPC